MLTVCDMINSFLFYDSEKKFKMWGLMEAGWRSFAVSASKYFPRVINLLKKIKKKNEKWIYYYMKNIKL